MRGPLQAVWLASLCAQALGCQHDLAAPEGVTVAGTVRYTGSAQRDLREPGLRVRLWSLYPPGGLQVPHAETTYFGQDVLRDGLQAYALRYVRPFDYYVVAELFERAEPDRVLARGAYPDVCALMDVRPPVRVGRAPLGDVDFNLYDHAGEDDPCVGTLPSDAGVGDGQAPPARDYEAFGRPCTPDPGGGPRGGPSADCPEGVPLCVSLPGRGQQCTAPGCDADPELCPPSWRCYDASALSPDAPFVCVP